MAKGEPVTVATDTAEDGDRDDETFTMALGAPTHDGVAFVIRCRIRIGELPGVDVQRELSNVLPGSAVTHLDRGASAKLLLRRTWLHGESLYPAEIRPDCRKFRPMTGRNIV